MIPTPPFFPHSAASGDGKKRRGLLSALCISIALSTMVHPALAEETPIDVDADTLEMDKDTHDMVARGNVVIQQSGLFKLQADEARYKGAENSITASGSIRLSRQGSLILADKIHLNLENHQGKMEKVNIDLEGPGGRGGAEKVVLTSDRSLTLSKGWYTNCDCEKPDWRLAAEEIIVDQDANSVEAKHMKLFFGDTPVAYFPWWRHPLRAERKSGLLFPKIRSSSGNGLEVETPYYWNIAPDRDMTVALRGISRRGVMGKGEYRYLGLGYEGQFSTNQIYDTQRDSYRGLTTFDHDHRIWGWDFSASGKYSRTRDFINDFEQDLVDGNARRLESHLTLGKEWISVNGYSDLQTGMLWYQDLEQSNDDLTIQRLPYLNFSNNRALSQEADGRRWRLQTEANFDSFYQMSGDAAQRIDLKPTIRFNKPLHVGLFSAQAGLRETAYLIQGDPNQSGINYDATEHREASLVSFRLDTKLAKTLAGNRQHTVEPSIEYVMNAATDQSHLPNYDATLRNFNTSNLFTTGQFSGSDRISTGQWVSYGLTTRLLSLVSGKNSLMETATFKIGQRWAPSGDQEYQDNHAFSDVVTSLDLDFVGGWSARADSRINPHEGEIARTDIDFQYSRSNQDSLSVGYHFNQPSTLILAEDGSERMEDLTLRSLLHLTDRWAYTQQANYSLETQNMKSWETQLEYASDCWSLGVKFGRQLSANNTDHGGTYYGLIFSLTGLSGEKK
ncbi:MAG: LPS-assembly protein LptD [Magnetococcales bacterium]|nr:LPS-assembly protein LptD [Magnetococcales bacterium]